MTNQRRLLLDLMHSAKGHMDAKELFRRASAKDDSISQATVYRTLNLFKKIGLIEERKLGRIRCHYEISRSPSHQHLICRGCGKILEFKTSYLQKLIESVKHRHGFNVTKAELLIEGYCSGCDEKETAPRSVPSRTV